MTQGASASASVVVLDYGSGNVHSAVKALERAGAEVSLTNNRDAAREADGLVVPGVGAFDAVMAQLMGVGGDEIVSDRLARRQPVLGICVGEQVMFERGLERGVDTTGLGHFPGAVRELRAPRLPHMGWNTVEAADGSTLFRGIETERFYFVHSYAATDWTSGFVGELGEARVSWAEHGERFIAAVERGPLSATQFHPEKSGEAGIQLLRNWVESLTPADADADETR